MSFILGLGNSSFFVLARVCLVPTLTISISTEMLVLRFRNIHGAHNSLVPDLLTSDKSSFRNFFRMDDESFRFLITSVSPKLTKSNTIMRQSVSANERLSVTLRYLATGNVTIHYKICQAYCTVIRVCSLSYNRALL